MSSPSPSPLFVALCCWLLLLGCGKGRVESPGKAPKGTYKPYTVGGKTYRPVQSAEGWVEEGIASWYGKAHHGRPTASGQIYDMRDMTAAHKLLPMFTRLKVENLDNGRSAEVLVNDRGPFVSGRILDLSQAAAEKLGVIGPGAARVRIAALDAPPRDEAGELLGEFYVQIGAFAKPENARALLDKVRRDEPKSRIVESDLGGRRLNRVQVFAGGALGAAERVRARLLTDHPDAFIIAD